MASLIQELLEELAGQKVNRAAYLRKTLGAGWTGLPDAKDLEDFIEKVGNADPTTNGAYMGWLAKLAIKDPKLNKLEDLARVGQDLAFFDAHKHKLSVKDINQLKSYQELYHTIKPLQAKPPSQEEIKLEQAKAGIETIYVGPEGWIKSPTTKETAKFIGQNTRWCTAAECDNMFDDYHRTDRLMIIYDKASKARFQLHLESGQLADEADEPLVMDRLPSWVWDHLVRWYQAKGGKRLSFNQLMQLQPRTQLDLAKGGPYEELIQLMRDHKVL